MEEVGENNRVHVVLEELVVVSVGADIVLFPRLLQALLPGVAQCDEFHSCKLRTVRETHPPPDANHSHANQFLFCHGFSEFAWCSKAAARDQANAQSRKSS